MARVRQRGGVRVGGGAGAGVEGAVALAEEGEGGIGMMGEEAEGVAVGFSRLPLWKTLGGICC